MSNLHGNSTLGVIYTMYHEVVPRRCKICDWLLKSSRDHFSVHQGKKNVRVTVKLKVPKLKGPHTFSTNMVQRVLWERQVRCSSRKRHGPMVVIILYYFSGILFGEEKVKTKERSNLPFLDIHLEKTQQIHFWCMVIPLESHSIYT